jgi:hypothetical protein
MTERSRIIRPMLFVLGAAVLAAAPARAQNAPSAPLAPVTTAPSQQTSIEVASTSAGPSVDAASVAVRRPAAESRSTAAAAGRYTDQGTRLMIVGGAAILTGLVIGGDAGHAISIGGAVIGLIGLYQYLQ